MTGIDWLIVLVVLGSVVLAAAQGFFFEIFSLAGVVFGYLLAAWEYWRVAARLRPFVSSPWVADIAGFLLVFLAMIVLAGMVARVARWGVQQAGLRWFDRVLGAAFGFLRGLLLVTVVALAMATFAPRSALLARSALTPYLLVAGRAAVWLAPVQLRQQFRKGVLVVRDMRLAADSGSPPLPARRK